VSENIKRIFQVGDASAVNSGDPYYSDERAAIEAAQRIARDDYHRPIAVWDERHEIVHLFLCGQQFRSV
jgi:hypothetical protein